MKFLELEMAEDHKKLIKDLAEVLAVAAKELSLIKNKHSSKANLTCENFLEDLISICRSIIGETRAVNASFIANTIITCTGYYIKQKGYNTFAREAKEFHKIVDTGWDVKADLLPDFIGLLNRIANLIAVKA